MSRGLNNFNPGNIRKGGKPFLGEVIPSKDPAFRQFETMSWGYRAMFVLINNYIASGKNTIAKIINTYAPSNENNTTAYINTVATKSGVNKDAPLTQSDTRLIQIISAMSFVENGVNAVASDVKCGWDMIPLKKKL